MVGARKRSPRPTDTPPTPEPEPVLAVGTITSKAQMTIPKRVRERLGIEAGDRVEFVEVSGRIIMRREFDPGVLDKWRGHATWLKGVDVDAFIDEMRGR